MDRKSDEKFSEKEAQKRFEAALRGARIAGPRHQENVTPKKSKPQRKSAVSRRNKLVQK